MPIFRSVKSAIERSKLVFLTMDGQTMSAWEWEKTEHCQRLGISYKMLLDRKRQQKWDDVTCLTIPKGKRREGTKQPGLAPIHLFTFRGKTMSARDWEDTEWCKSRGISASMLRSRRDNKWSDKKALTTPKVEPSKIPTYRHKKETEEQGITAPEFYKRLHRMAAEWGVN